MIIKRSFKLLNAFCLGLENKIMFFSRQSYQVAWAVIASDAIKVMDNPTFWHWLSMCLFPNKDMFKDIVFCRPHCSGVVRIIDQNITTTINSSTLPIWVFISPSLHLETVLPRVLTRTTSAKFCIGRLTAIFTRVLSRKIFISLLSISILFILIRHSFIISYLASKCKQRDNMSHFIEDLEEALM